MTLVLGDWPVAEMSPAERLASLPEDARSAILAELTPEQQDSLRWDWDFFARPAQLPPDDFSVWMVNRGRGTGKTLVGSQWARKKGPLHAEGLLIGANPRDARDLMIDGRSGIISISPPWERPEYEPTKLLLRWPNGAIAHVRSAEDPGGIRGLSVEWVWCDEIVKWRYLQETWDQSRLALREGVKPQTVVTTTPMPLPLIKRLVSGGQRGVVVAQRESTYRNAANLAPDFLQELIDTFEGTRLGRQELHAEILEDVKGALWDSAMIEAAQWPKESWHETATGLFVPGIPKMRKVTTVDPSGSTTGDECGIIVTGATTRRPTVGFVLADKSLRGPPEEWGRVAVETYYEHNCEAVVAEVNYGGEMVERVIHATPAHGPYPDGESVNVVVLRAGRGQSKYQRAVPIAGMFEQNLTTPHKRVWLVGNFPLLTSQLTSWVPPETATSDSPPSNWSPDRLDGMVWGLLYLMVIERRREGKSHAKTLIGG